MPNGFISEYFVRFVLSFVVGHDPACSQAYVGDSHMGIVDLIHTLTDAISLLSATLKFWREWRESKRKPRGGRRRA